MNKIYKIGLRLDPWGIPNNWSFHVEHEFLFKTRVYLLHIKYLIQFKILDHIGILI